MAMNITAKSFIYDNVNCETFGLMICEVGGSGGISTSKLGADITVSSSSTYGNDIFTYTNNSYDKPLTISQFDLCCIDDNCIPQEIDSNKARAIGRWLHQKNTGFKRLQFCDEDNADIIYYAKPTSIEKILISGRVVGFRIGGFETNSPYAWTDDLEVPINMTTSQTTFNFMDYGDEVEKITIPNIKIELLENCNFEIYNALTNSTFKIDNCKQGEIITINGFKTQLSSNIRTAQEMFKSFNNVFFNYTNTYRNFVNPLTIKGKANITITTRFPRKVGE